VWKNNKTLFVVLLSVLALLSLIIPLFFGEKTISVFAIFRRPNSLNAEIVLNIRLPRIFFAFLTGGSLALTGAVFQALLRNDLATPYTLGVSSGSALGAVLAIKTGLDFSLLGFSAVSLFSIAGSLITLFIIYRIARSHRGFSTYTLILAGVTISLTFSAIILFVHYLADFTETYRMVRWLMGGLDVSGWHHPLFLSVILFLAVFYFFRRVLAFNLLTAGEDFALSKGLNLDKLQKHSFVVASVLVGAVVSIAGPIAFIGLIVPHMLRLMIGPDHRRLFPGTLLFGGAFLVWCDTIARLIIYPAELPVGIITSLLGGPFFIYMLMKNK